MKYIAENWIAILSIFISLAALFVAARGHQLSKETYKDTIHNRWIGKFDRDESKLYLVKSNEKAIIQKAKLYLPDSFSTVITDSEWDLHKSKYVFFTVAMNTTIINNAKGRAPKKQNYGYQKTEEIGKHVNFSVPVIIETEYTIYDKKINDSSLYYIEGYAFVFEDENKSIIEYDNLTYGAKLDEQINKKEFLRKLF